MPLNDFEGHFSLFETFPAPVRPETYQEFTNSASRGPSAVAELLVTFAAPRLCIVFCTN